jgi:DNA-binding MarR family transcriptional regulator
MIQQTSILSFRKTKQTNIGKRQQQVLDALSEIAPANNREIAKEAGLDINVVTPRVLELRVKGRIEKAYQEVDFATGRTVNYWKPKGKLSKRYV